MTRIPINTQRRRRPDAPLPMDIRAMNLLTLVCGVAAVLLSVWTMWSVLKRSPHFAVQSIEVVTPLQRASLAQLRSLAAPRMAGNFFEIDVAAAKAAFESVPWVRRAHVRRMWPNALEVSLEEHRAVAYWEDDQGDEQLVNEYGEVFDANMGEVDDAVLPTLEGPVGTSKTMLSLHQRLAPLMKQIDSRIDVLRLSRRGSWQVVLDSGAEIELGRGPEIGDVAEVMVRTERFVRTFGEAAQRLGNAELKRADLRHPQGYALHMAPMPPTTVHPSATPPHSRTAQQGKR
jgi:cell division protein FtsQ